MSVVEVGQRFGRWVVLAPVEDKWRMARFLCRCDCGTESVVIGHGLRAGKSKSCGCYRRAVVGQRVWKHGKSLTPAYRSWSGMKRRCQLKTMRFYGQRGITMCERWESFENFLADMGERPEGMTLDRIDPNGNYEPGNCRWATRSEQAINRRSTRLIELDGTKKCLTQWARDLGLSPSTIQTRLDSGWPLREALTTPRKRLFRSGSATSSARS